MKRWIIAILAGVSIALVAFMSCESGGDDDDDDNGCKPNDVAGSYPVTITWEQHSCNEGMVGTSESGVMDIEQDGNSAKVFFTKYGSGSERKLIFKGKVCENTISATEEKDTQLEDYNCTKHEQTTYNLQYNPNTSPESVSGEFSGTYIWSGDDCEDQGITPVDEQCSWKKSIKPTSQ